MASPVDYVSAVNSKFEADKERRRLLVQGAAAWQVLPEPRALGSVRRLAADAAHKPPHPKLPHLLGQLLLKLGSPAGPGGLEIDHLCALTPTTSSTLGSGFFLVRCNNNKLTKPAPGSRDDPSGSADDLLLVKVLPQEAPLLREAHHLRWAASVLGPLRVPRLLLQEPVTGDGLSALPLELVAFRPRASGAARCSSFSLADLLGRGATAFALEDLRSAICEVPDPSGLLQELDLCLQPAKADLRLAPGHAEV
ncbi:unnamed protein product, partial [Polarella glacialis]